ncbi:DNA-directed RNA polymerase subunit beta' [Candidatus Omnitrophus magneticus]|uniref:DNA-directed RNA polymerase subunit beta' n=1 Tax=Candidatus Omnitrophus magneticus TaxID=1609969 RepID=A0A0F0CTN0_9BACT|nr:DNA-directed RNA polymerase subunit beta' [Candidatus Omnitrophus magneticus]
MIPKTNKFDKVKIQIASPEIILGWATRKVGNKNVIFEVKKPETINYRTLKPERDGLFCERIFGPVKDYECNCGKYKRIKYKGIVCDRCGVEVTKSSIRRDRMGCIRLATPVSHVWFFKAIPSRMANVLDIKMRDLERVLYYEQYIVVSAGDTSLKAQQLLSEEQYLEAKEKYGNKFKALMGAEAIRELLKSVDLNAEVKDLHLKIEEKKDLNSKKRLVKRLKIIDSFRKSDNQIEWMILDVIPVIPPDLRPLVPLDGGRFATSDLNDLYRRVINRNNRLKKLLELRAPEVIIRNEKRMLQEAVDALFDNGRHGREVLGAGARPLKSLADMLKGKQGRFRQNLLGKRVDYSGRSVIVIGPELKIHECGLPKAMALELFQPFIIRKLREKGFVHTIKSAKRMVQQENLEVWDILDDVIKDHPVLLNRAPTLHRLGIQAFQPKLIEGKAIRIHPLVCAAFNADFDGDQMAVHVPLSIEAQMEARLIMNAANNIFSSASGKPITTPSQDIVLGLYYLTKLKNNVLGSDKSFSNIDEVIMAYQNEQVHKHAKIKVRINGKTIETTAGRVLFNSILPAGVPFYNEPMTKKAISQVISDCYRFKGHEETVALLDRLKDLGFEESTSSGASMAVSDLMVPKEKEERVKKAYQEVEKIHSQYQRGFITDGERYNKIIDVWTHVTEDISSMVFRNLDTFNPVFMMADSGARGSRQQIRQLAGIRGLMAKPSGEIIETPIVANFREGLTVLEYFISTHGARKGLADTALKTADSGYLTRRLVDVAQEVIVTGKDCGTMNGVTAIAVVEGDEVVIPLSERIVGRVAVDNIVDIISDEVIVKVGEVITEEKAKRIEESGMEKIRIRSVLTCEMEEGICSKCYGINLSTGKMSESGEAVGIIAAQSIGEPGTQLTMRTFHIGGTASRIVEQTFYKSKENGIVKYHNLRVVEAEDGRLVVLNRNGQITINEEDGREIDRQAVPQGSYLFFKDGEQVKKGEKYIEWEPYTVPILAEQPGIVQYEDIKENLTVKIEKDEATGLSSLVVLGHKDDYHPQLLLVNEAKEVEAIYPLPIGAHIVVNDKERVNAGHVLAKTPRVVTKTKDITGGLPRVAELFEARKPKDPSIISEIDGRVEFGETKKGQKRIIVESESGMRKEYLIPHGKHINVYRGDFVKSGERLVDGPVVLQDILRVSGEKELQEYLVNEVQQVYRLQGVQINDKHIEIIVRQMLKNVKITDPGDTEFLLGDKVDKILFQDINKKMIDKKKKPALAEPILQGITKASLTTESFISAASFQETTRVLTEAAAMGKEDTLKGLKENIIMGHLIPAGTGYKDHQEIAMDREILQTVEES